MAAPRYLEVVYCDDIRHEIKNKVSFMGVYTGDFIVPQFPFTASQLCFYVTASTPANQPFKMITLRVLRDDEVLLEAQVPEAQLAADQNNIISSGDPNAEDPRFAMHFQLHAGNLTFEKPTKIRVRVSTESEELKARALRILPPSVLQQAQNSASTSH